MDTLLYFLLIVIGTSTTSQAQTLSGSSSTAAFKLPPRQSSVNRTNLASSRPDRRNDEEVTKEFQCPGYNGQFADSRDCRAYYKLVQYPLLIILLFR